MCTDERIEALRNRVSVLEATKVACHELIRGQNQQIEDLNVTLQYSEEELAYALNQVYDLKDEIVTWHLHHDDCYRPYEVEELKKRNNAQAEVIKELEDLVNPSFGRENP
jgi:chromosome segregation ATPase